MEPFVWVLAYEFVLCICIINSSLLMQYSLSNTAKAESILLFSALNGMCFMVYYVCMCIFQALCARKRRNRYKVEYNDLQTCVTEVVKGRPKLHIEDVWVLVYGLGLCFFTISLVSTCMYLLSLQTLMYGLALIVGHEIASSTKKLLHPENIMYCLVSLICLAAVFIKGIDHNYHHWAAPFLDVNIFEIVFGIFLPLMISFMFVHVKIDTRYSFEGIFELCEFGFPFYFIMCVFTASLFKLYQCNLDFSLFLYETHLPVTLVFSPFPLLLTFLMIMEALMKNHMVDVMISFAFSYTLMELVHNGQNQIALISMVLSLVAFFIRLSLFARQKPEEVPVKPVAEYVINDEEEQLPTP